MRDGTNSGTSSIFYSLWQKRGSIKNCTLKFATRHCQTYCHFDIRAFDSTSGCADRAGSRSQFRCTTLGRSSARLRGSGLREHRIQLYEDDRGDVHSRGDDDEKDESRNGSLQKRYPLKRLSGITQERLAAINNSIQRTFEDAKMSDEGVDVEALESRAESYMTPNRHTRIEDARHTCMNQFCSCGA